MLNKALNDILIDRFEAYELCEFLGIEIEEFLERFEDAVEENEEDLYELAGLRGIDDESGSDDLS